MIHPADKAHLDHQGGPSVSSSSCRYKRLQLCNRMRALLQGTATITPIICQSHRRHSTTGLTLLISAATEPGTRTVQKASQPIADPGKKVWLEREPTAFNLRQQCHLVVKDYTDPLSLLETPSFSVCMCVTIITSLYLVITQ